MKNLKMKAARAGKDLSQQELAEIVGVSRQTISAIEKEIIILQLIFVLVFARHLIKLWMIYFGPIKFVLVYF